MSLPSLPAGWHLGGGYLINPHDAAQRYVLKRGTVDKLMVATILRNYDELGAAALWEQSGPKEPKARKEPQWLRAFLETPGDRSVGIQPMCLEVIFHGFEKVEDYGIERETLRRELRDFADGVMDGTPAAVRFSDEEGEAA